MKRILLTGGPGTGKTTILSELHKRGYNCLQEISRNIILEAQQRGIQQLFLTHPKEFNTKLLNGRITQFKTCCEYQDNFVFLDRGLPDIMAYNNYVKAETSDAVIKATKEHTYDFVFVFPPWKNIYKNDNERYETFEEAQKIYNSLKQTYIDLGYEIFEVPTGEVSQRANYILNIIEYS